LDAITIGGIVKSRLHQSPIMTGGRLGGGPAEFGGDDRTNVALLASEGMVWLGVITGVGRDAAHPHPRERCGEERSKVRHVGLRSASLVRGKNEMRLNVADDA